MNLARLPFAILGAIIDRLLPAADVQIAAAERGLLAFEAMNETIPEPDDHHDDAPGFKWPTPPHASSQCRHCTHTFASHPFNAGIHNPCDLCKCVDFGSASAASEPPTFSFQDDLAAEQKLMVDAAFPNTADLNGDLEVELALSRIEVSVLARQLKFARGAFKFHMGRELVIPTITPD